MERGIIPDERSGRYWKEAWRKLGNAAAETGQAAAVLLGSCKPLGLGAVQAADKLRKASGELADLLAALAPETRKDPPAAAEATESRSRRQQQAVPLTSSAAKPWLADRPAGTKKKQSRT